MMRAQKSEHGTPSTIFRAPAVAPSVESGSSTDEFPAGAIGLTRMAAEIVRARHAYDQRVAEAAYYLALRRRFGPGRELEDWVAAEVQIATASSHPERKQKEPEG
jgi:hypothetical protein